jgi:hypothetical protein
VQLVPLHHGRGGLLHHQAAHRVAQHRGERSDDRNVEREIRQGVWLPLRGRRVIVRVNGTAGAYNRPLYKPQRSRFYLLLPLKKPR